MQGAGHADEGEEGAVPEYGNQQENADDQQDCRHPAGTGEGCLPSGVLGQTMNFYGGHVGWIIYYRVG